MNLHKLISSLVIATGLILGSGSNASAQIYSWRDTNGNLVLSNRRPGDVAAVKSYQVPASDGFRTTRYVPESHADSYDDLIVEHARRNGVRQSLVRAVIQVESAFNPTALSPKGAIGLMQLMPATARELGVANAFDPEENVKAGVRYLRQLLDRYDNDEQLALAAYNAGPGAVDRHGQAVPPYRETKNYVSRVNELAGRTRGASGGIRIYKSIEIIDGREVVKYTDRKPDEGSPIVISR